VSDDVPEAPAAAVTAPAPPPAPAPSARRTWIRLGVLALVLVVSGIVADQTGLTEHLTRERIRDQMEALGPLGAVLFIALFTVGELAHVPGWVFVGAAILAYGQAMGGLLSYVGAQVALAAAFVVVRAIGGDALSAIERPFVKRMLAAVDSRPVLAVAGLRAVLLMTPALTYALAMTRVRFWPYVVGNLIGLAIPIALMAYFFEWFLAR
jgi:uncharacterized membrane protein YdjX (TVP38/TMEM64 family)